MSPMCQCVCEWCECLRFEIMMGFWWCAIDERLFSGFIDDTLTSRVATMKVIASRWMLLLLLHGIAVHHAIVGTGIGTRDKLTWRTCLWFGGLGRWLKDFVVAGSGRCSRCGLPDNYTNIRNVW